MRARTELYPLKPKAHPVKNRVGFSYAPISFSVG